MESHRILIVHAELDGVPVDLDYADLFVVVREGATGPSPTDWEAQLRSTAHVNVRPSQHHLALASPDGAVYRGAAITRFSDGFRHLFRGDGHLEGFERD